MIYKIKLAFKYIFRIILKNISEIIKRIIENEITEASTGIVSFDSYWTFIK